MTRSLLTHVAPRNALLVHATLCRDVSTSYADDRPSLFVLTDVGGVPDSQQSLIRLTVHSTQPEKGGRSANFRGVYVASDETLTNREWDEPHLLAASPPEGLYPTRTSTGPNPYRRLREETLLLDPAFYVSAATPPSDPRKPDWGGRYLIGNDGWLHDLSFTEDFDPSSTASRWQAEYQADFANACDGPETIDPSALPLL